MQTADAQFAIQAELESKRRMREYIMKGTSNGWGEYVCELTRCKDCMAFDEKKVLCKKNNMIAVREDDWCSRAVRKEE